MNFKWIGSQIQKQGNTFDENEDIHAVIDDSRSGGAGDSASSDPRGGGLVVVALSDAEPEREDPRRSFRYQHCCLVV